MFQLTSEECRDLKSQSVTSSGHGGHRLRRMFESNVGLARKLDALERKYDGQFKTVFEAIRQMMAPPSRSRRKIGFK